ncbi:N-acetyl-D-Glu racemase DgcA [Psychromonas aquatilis]|uniref:Dipeptide epimerase n=1 Tax=Psychromonas aquatilis TaxID=2005072 RepID=A0ABU9GMF3_9GAMM
MRHVEIDVVEIPLSRPFTISRGTRSSVTVVRVSIEEAGFIGLGECTPTARYNQSTDSVVAQLNAVKAEIEAGASRTQLQALLPAGSARNVLDCALWRLTAATQQKTLWQATDIAQPNSIVTAETISLDSLEAMVASTLDAVSRGAKLLKIKLDSQQIIEKVAAIRKAAPDNKLIIDANEAWGKCDLPAIIEQLNQYDIAMLEQPLPAGKDQRLSEFKHVIPICADESCHVATDIAALKQRYEFINIKLDKCGGLTEALDMVKVAKQHDMRLMVGCMLGSSLAMSAALPIAAQCELVDVDGPIWLAVDSTPYLTYQQGDVWT